MNYLEHEDKVKYIDGLLAREQEWQWFVACIEKNFNLSDINSWSEYLNRNKAIRDVYSYFVKVSEICDKEWIIETEVLKEIIIVSRYFLGILDTDYCITSLQTNVGRLLFLTIWLTKLENQDNKTTYLADMRIFKYNNLWEIICFDSLGLVCDKIEEYLYTLNIEGIDTARKCVLDNINKISYSMQEGFIEEHRDKFLSADAISFKSERVDDNSTWQEEYLFQMLQVSISDRKLKPLMIFEGVASPDSSLWSLEVIENMKEYFSDESTDFILETIAYIEHKLEPTAKTKLWHCKLLEEFVNKAEKLYEVVRCSSYATISYMFEDKMFRGINKEADYISLIQTMQQIDDALTIKRMQEDKYPLSANQKRILNEYYDELACQIDTIEDVHVFMRYLENPDVTKRIDTNNFIKVCKYFYECIEKNDRDLLTASLFYKYMLFLMGTNAVATEVDKRLIRTEIIHVQKVWQDNFYSKQAENLRVFMHETTALTTDVDAYNAAILINPIIVAKSCMLPEEEQMCKVMELSSEHAIIYLITRVHLSPVYPIIGDTINFEKHDIDIMLRQTVEGIRQNKAYKFLNVLDTDVYVAAIHKRYQENARVAVAMFKGEEQVYQLIQKDTGYNLIPYDNNITVAHLTQLFPLLEIKIRELASLIGIVPFKERVTDFMTYKDSSSVLREMLQEVHKELGSFKNVPDLLFIYHFMYNGNSLNVRNECLHGRDYLNGSNVRFAFRLTLLAIYMLKYRIDVIYENMSDAEDIKSV